MKRSTKTAPVSLSTSYLIGSPRIGISMITLQSFGMSLPAGTRSKLIGGGDRGRRSMRLYEPRGTGEWASGNPKPRPAHLTSRASAAGATMKVVFAILGILAALAVAVSVAWFYVLGSFR